MQYYFHLAVILGITVTNTFLLPIWQRPLQVSQFVAVEQAIQNSHHSQSMLQEMYQGIVETWKCCLSQFVDSCLSKNILHVTAKLCGYYRFNNDGTFQGEKQKLIEVHKIYFVSLYFRNFFIERSIIDCGYGSIKTTFDNTHFDVFCGRRLPFTLAGKSSEAFVTYYNLQMNNTVNDVLMAYYITDPRDFKDTHHEPYVYLHENIFSKTLNLLGVEIDPNIKPLYIYPRERWYFYHIIVSRWANILIEKITTNYVTHECEVRKSNSSIALYLGPPGANMYLRTHILGNAFGAKSYKGFQITLKLSIGYGPVCTEGEVKISFVASKPPIDDIYTLNLDSKNRGLYLEPHKICHHSGFPFICHIKIQPPIGHFPNISIHDFTMKTFDQGLCEYSGISIGQDASDMKKHTGTNANPSTVKVSDVTLPVENVTFCFLNNQNRTHFVGGTPDVTLTFYSYVNLPTDLYSNIRISLDYTRCQGYLIMNAIQLLDKYSHISYIEIGNKFVSDWYSSLKPYRYFSSCYYNIRMARDNGLQVFKTGYKFPGFPAERYWMYGSEMFKKEFQIVWFNHFLLCSCIHGPSYYFSFFYMPQSCISISNFPSTSVFSKSKVIRQTYEIFVHTMIMCFYGRCNLHEVPASALLQGHAQINFSPPIRKLLCDIESNQRGDVNSIKDNGPRNFILSSDTACSEYFTITTVECVNMPNLLLQLNESQLDNIIGKNTSMLHYILDRHATSCPQLMFPADKYAHLSVYRPTDTVHVTIKPHAKEQECNPTANRINIYIIRNHAQSHMKVIKYKFHSPPLQGAPVRARFESLHGKTDYLLVHLTRRLVFLGGTKPCGVQALLTFPEKKLSHWNVDPNYQKALAYDRSRYAKLYKGRIQDTIFEDVSWKEAHKFCTNKGADSLLAFPDHRYLVQHILPNISTDHLQKHVPIFVGAMQQVYSRLKCTCINIRTFH